MATSEESLSILIMVLPSCGTMMRHGLGQYDMGDDLPGIETERAPGLVQRLVRGRHGLD